uniref:Uncharacterized protein n=1 Tax=Rhodnius prolixus TaxID=13249 RepID=T1IA75_RHOPR
MDCLVKFLKYYFCMPSRTNEHSFINNDYTAAERISQHLSKEQQCASKFPSCPATLLDLISIVETSEYTEDIIVKLTELL